MKPKTVTTIATYGLLCCAGGISFLLPDTLTPPPVFAAGGLPDEIHVLGLVRDFNKAHADFDAAQSNHVVGLLDGILGVGAKPAWDGPGNRVIQQATNQNGDRIAPQWAGEACSYPPLMVDGSFIGRNYTVFDGYRSDNGVYGPSNSGASVIIGTNSTAAGAIDLQNSSTIMGDVKVGVGGDPAVVVDIQSDSNITGLQAVLENPVPMPDVDPPAGSPFTDPAGGAIIVPNSGSVTVNSDRHVTGITVGRGGRLRITADVTILCDGDMEVEKDGEVVINSNASLTLHLEGRYYSKQGHGNTDTDRPSAFKLYMMGDDPASEGILLESTGTTLCAQVFAPNVGMMLEQTSTFYGTFWGWSLEAYNSSAMHLDMSANVGNPLSDLDSFATLDNSSDDGGITSSATFDDWFNDVPGVNMTTPYLITFVRQADDNYLYDATLDEKLATLNGFFPIDDRLLGNEGDPHNHNLTYHWAAEFTYEEDAGQYFKYEGHGEVWAYIDDEIVIDLGGASNGTRDQMIEVDRLCLDDGETYALAFFYAHRRGSQADMRMETNIEFTGITIPVVNDQFD